MIATMICLFVVVADMPDSTFVEFFIVKGAGLAGLAFFVKRLERILPNEEV